MLFSYTAFIVAGSIVMASSFIINVHLCLSSWLLSQEVCFTPFLLYQLLTFLILSCMIHFSFIKFSLLSFFGLFLWFYFVTKFYNLETELIQSIFMPLFFLLESLKAVKFFLTIALVLLDIVSYWVLTQFLCWFLLWPSW